MAVPDTIPDDVAQQRAALEAQRAAVLQRQQANEAQRRDLAAGYDRSATPLEASITQEESALGAMKPPEASPAPQMAQIDPKQYQQLAFGMLAMALVGGGASRNHWMGALSSLNGAMKGLKEGKDEEVKAAYADYDRKFKAAQAHDAQANKEFQDVLNSKKLSINEKIEQLRFLGEKYQRQDAVLAADGRSLDKSIDQFNAHEAQLTSVTQRDQAARARIEVVLKNQNAGPAGGLLDEDTAKEMAQQYLAGDKSVMQNLGRGRQGAENIVRLRKAIQSEMKATGMGGADVARKMAEFEGLKSTERTLGTRTANADMAVTEAKNLAPLALQASQGFDRSNFVPLADAETAVAKNTGSPQLKRFVTATNSLINAYARGIAPTGVGTVSDKDHAREVLSTRDGPRAYAAGVDQLMKELDAAQRSPGRVKEDVGNAFAGHKGTADNPVPLDEYLKAHGH